MVTFREWEGSGEVLEPVWLLVNGHSTVTGGYVLVLYLYIYRACAPVVDIAWNILTVVYSLMSHDFILSSVVIAE